MLLGLASPGSRGASMRNLILSRMMSPPAKFPKRLHPPIWARTTFRRTIISLMTHFRPIMGIKALRDPRNLSVPLTDFCSLHRTQLLSKFQNHDVTRQIIYGLFQEGKWTLSSKQIVMQIQTTLLRHMTVMRSVMLLLSASSLTFLVWRTLFAPSSGSLQRSRARFFLPRSSMSSAPPKFMNRGQSCRSPRRLKRSPR